MAKKVSNHEETGADKTAQPTEQPVEQSAVNVYDSILQHHPGLNLGALQIGRELILVHTLLMAQAEEYLRPYDLSWSKLYILLWLRAYQENRDSGLAPSQLSEFMSLSRNTISSLLEGLEQRQYVSRELDRQDKRRFVIRITPEGLQVAQTCLIALCEKLEVLLGPLDQGQRTELLANLQLFQTVLSKNISKTIE